MEALIDPSTRQTTKGIINSDATFVLQLLRAEGQEFDVVIADPPYNIGKDFGQGKESMPMEDYLAWSLEWISHCLELLTDQGLLYLYGLPEIIARIAVNYPLESQRWLVWHYTNKAVPSSRFWQRSHETILCLWKPGSDRPSLELDQIREPYTANFARSAGRERKDTPSRYGSPGRRTVYNMHEKGALPRDVFKIPALAGGAGRSERWFVCRTCDQQLHPPQCLHQHRGHDILKHPTQKPSALTRRLIQSRINGKSGRVLIPFAGSGSECVVAKALGVEFLAVELNPEYVDFARQWVSFNEDDHKCTA